MKNSISLILNLCPLFLVICFACSRDKSPLVPISEEPNPRILKGNARLENQTDHFGIFVYLEGLKQYTITDENGDYTLTLPDSLFAGDTLCTEGTFHLYYSFPYYDFDSTSVTTDKQGFVFGKDNLDKNGQVTAVELNQVLSIKTETDKDTYTPQDSIWVKSTVINCSERELGMGLIQIRGVDLFDGSKSWWVQVGEPSPFTEDEIKKLAPGEKIIEIYRYSLANICDSIWSISLPWNCRVWRIGCYVAMDGNKWPKAPAALKGIVGPDGWYSLRRLNLPLGVYDLLMRDSFALAEITILNE